VSGEQGQGSLPDNRGDKAGERPQTEAQALSDAIRDVLQVLASGEATHAEPLSRDELERHAMSQDIELKREAFNQELDLRKKYANWLILGMFVQLAIADLAFFLVASLGFGWKLDASIMNVWLGGTVIQVVSIVVVVARHLFPRRDKALGEGQF
jgi:hypothetical protein